ncbi:hypothetical protein BC670_1093 [Flavobacterium branchiophilum]|uniref:Uncharacterized protein n=1 Tax=Flavobacterium branchiophilum TaxID=55197 RepID=A0A543G2B6_9FLAO|nr:hypothetical protein BC670_1093 [Flavobacterium branchiophilum]
MRSYFLEKIIQKKSLHSWATELFFLTHFSKKEQVDWTIL